MSADTDTSALDAAFGVDADHAALVDRLTIQSGRVAGTTNRRAFRPRLCHQRIIDQVLVVDRYRVAQFRAHGAARTQAIQAVPQQAVQRGTADAEHFRRMADVPRRLFESRGDAVAFEYAELEELKRGRFRRRRRKHGGGAVGIRQAEIGEAVLQLAAEDDGAPASVAQRRYADDDDIQAKQQVGPEHGRIDTDKSANKVVINEGAARSVTPAPRMPLASC